MEGKEWPLESAEGREWLQKIFHDQSPQKNVADPAGDRTRNLLIIRQTCIQMNHWGQLMKKKKRVFVFFKLGIVQCCHCLMSWDSLVCSETCLPTRCTTLPHGFESGLGHKDVVYVRKVVSSLTTEVVSQKVFPRQQQTTKAFLHHQTVLQGWLFSGVTGAEYMKRRKILMTTLYIIYSSHREISPSPAEAGCTMHLQTAEEANWSGSALFVIQYVNLYQQTGSSNLNGWQSGRGISIYSA